MYSKFIFIFLFGFYNLYAFKNIQTIDHFSHKSSDIFFTAQIQSIFIGILFITILLNIFIYFLGERKTTYLIFVVLIFNITIHTTLLDTSFLKIFFDNIIQVQWLSYLLYCITIPIYIHYHYLAYIQKPIDRFVILNLYSAYIILGFIIACSTPILHYSKEDILYKLSSILYLYLSYKSLTLKHKISILIFLSAIVLFLHLFIFKEQINSNYLIEGIICLHIYIIFTQFAQELYYSIKLSKIFQKFVPQEFLYLLNKKKIYDIHLGDYSQKEMTILVSDIRGFTKMSEQLTTKETFNFLNSYLTQIGPILRKYNGFIDKYLGDGITAIFAENSINALNAALDITTFLTKFNIEQSQKLKQEIKIGIGIHYESMTLGAIGEHEHLNTTIVSNAIYIANLAEQETKLHKCIIIITEKYYEQIKNHTNIKFEKIKSKDDMIFYKVILPL